MLKRGKENNTITKEMFENWIYSRQTTLRSDKNRNLVKVYDANDPRRIYLFSQYGFSDSCSFSDDEAPLIAAKDMQYMGIYDMKRKELLDICENEWIYWSRRLKREVYECHGPDREDAARQLMYDILKYMKEYIWKNEDYLVDKFMDFQKNNKTNKPFCIFMERLPGIISTNAEKTFGYAKELKFPYPYYDAGELNDRDFFEYIDSPDKLTVKKFTEFALGYQGKYQGHENCYADSDRFKLSFEEDMGLQLMIYRKTLQEMEILEKDKTSPLYRSRQIISSLADEKYQNAVNVNVTVQRDGIPITFKYPVKNIRNHSMWLSCIVQADTRNYLESLYGSTLLPYQDIVKITYGRKTIYEQ